MQNNNEKYCYGKQILYNKHICANYICANYICANYICANYICANYICADDICDNNYYFPRRKVNLNPEIIICSKDDCKCDLYHPDFQIPNYYSQKYTSS